MVDVSWWFHRREKEVVAGIVEKYEDTPFVEMRRERNVEPGAPKLDESTVWDAHLIAQLTSQQRSGPDSHVHRFLRDDRDSVSLDKCREADDPAAFIAEQLEKAGGIRFYNKVGEAMATNLETLEDGGWSALEEALEPLQRNRDREARADDWKDEREACRFLYDEIGGDGLHRIGPKQSRNLLQALGLTRFGTPLDSRVTKWLNRELDLPYRLTGSGLGNPSFYDFHMDLVRHLCDDAEVLPCVFDAAVFTSYDPDWPEDDAGNAIVFDYSATGA